MSISLKNHEDRISVLESKTKKFEYATILNQKVNITKSTLLKYDFSKWLDWDFIYVAFDAWGEPRNYDYNVVDEGLIPLGLLKHMWCQRIQMFGSDYGAHEGVKFYLGNGTDLQVKYAGTEVHAAIWKIIALKIYYIFRYNIKQTLKLISPILKF